MATVTAKYLGDLRVECTHVASGTKLVSDAPVDNNGKGEAFSPTDLCVTALASCAMTIIGIYGKMHNVDVVGTEIEVAKTMSANPRRIGKIEVTFIMPDREYTDKQKTMIERAAHTCPVHLSLHPDVEQVFLSKTEHVVATRWNDLFCDVVPAKGGKDYGVRAALERFGIAPEEAIAFGDGENDLGMFEVVGTSIAMGNAWDGVKERASFVTTDVDDDGIWNACKELGII